MELIKQQAESPVPPQEINDIKTELPYDEPSTSFVSTAPPPQMHITTDSYINDIKPTENIYYNPNDPMLIKLDSIGMELDGRPSINLFLEKPKKTGRPKS